MIDESHPCERPGCTGHTTGDWLYCSPRCFKLDNDPTPITIKTR